MTDNHIFLILRALEVLLIKNGFPEDTPVLASIKRELCYLQDKYRNPYDNKRS